MKVGKWWNRYVGAEKLCNVVTREVTSVWAVTHTTFMPIYVKTHTMYCF